MRVIMMKIGAEADICEIDGSLEGMQGIVGGLIELFCPFENESVGIIVNEEGKLLGLDENRAVVQDHKIIDILCGPAFIVSLNSEDGDFCSVTDEQIERLMPKITKNTIWC